MKRRILMLMVIGISLFAFCHWQNNAMTISEIVVKQDSLPKGFEGYKILQLSDLHNKQFGSKQNKLLAKIEQINPDMIVVTGDLIDSSNPDLETAMDLINGAVRIAPMYYVSGNHEDWSGMYEHLKSKLENSGVIVLDNRKVEVFNNGDSIEIIGLADPSFMGGTGETKNVLNTLVQDNEKFKVLLAHRPELFDLYASTDVNLIFSGHAHGGQFRLPFIGGFVAPDQGIFPKLTEGIHTQNNVSMVISRGLGNSIIPLRLFNRPELIVVTLSNLK